MTAGEGGEKPTLALLNLDETIGEGENPPLDRYNVGEAAQDDNGTADDTDVTTITVSETPTQVQAIGELSTDVGALESLFANANVDFGTDGAGPDGGISKSLALVLSGESVATSLTATALEGTALEGMSEAERAIVLVQVDADTIEGHIVGDGDPQTADEFVAFRITLVGGSDPSTATITVTQFLAIDHGGSEDPSVFDEQAFLNTIGADTLSLQLTTTATDGDGDQASLPVQVTLIGNETTFVAFDDDGPAVTAGEGGDTAPAWPAQPGRDDW